MNFKFKLLAEHFLEIKLTLMKITHIRNVEYHSQPPFSSPNRVRSYDLLRTLYHAQKQSQAPSLLHLSDDKEFLWGICRTSDIF